MIARIFFCAIIIARSFFRAIMILKNNYCAEKATRNHDFLFLTFFVFPIFFFLVLVTNFFISTPYPIPCILYLVPCTLYPILQYPKKIRTPVHQYSNTLYLLPFTFSSVKSTGYRVLGTRYYPLLLLALYQHPKRYSCEASIPCCCCLLSVNTEKDTSFSPFCECFAREGILSVPSKKVFFLTRVSFRKDSIPYCEGIRLNFFYQYPKR